MEYFLVHGYTWVPPQWRLPFFLALAFIALRLGWKSDPSQALCRRLGYFSLASAFYFCMASRAVMVTDTGHDFEFDAAKTTALVFLVISVILFVAAGKRKERRTGLDFGRFQFGGEDEG
ncbi:MAG: hypothetical protein M3N19_03695 [Candidatus Eremiobacteraeota bacterium]|nr:hypothetical protein [Candidatus Eremiobacteraeota bacterium]